MQLQNVIMSAQNKNPKIEDPRDVKIRELESHIEELKEREKIIQEIRNAQEDILKKSKLLAIQSIFFTSITGLILKIYSKYFSETCIGRFYRKCKRFFSS